MSNKKIVKFKKSVKGYLRDDNLVHIIVQDVKDQLGEKNLEHYKYDVQILIDVCNCIEKNASKKKKNKTYSKTTKKEIALKIFSELYQEIDLNLIEASIESILNNKLVKKYDFVNKLYRFVSNFFLQE